jgi:hypothetical protein
MRKLIYKFTLFISIIVTLHILLFLHFNFQVKRNINNYILPKHINSLIIGDSHIQLAFNEKLIENSVNISNASEVYMHSYEKIKKITTNNSQIRTIYIGASYHNFSSYYDTEIYSLNSFKKYFYIYSIHEQIQQIGKYEINSDFVSSVYKQFFSNIFSDWMGGFEVIKSDIFLTKKTIRKRILAQYYNENTLNSLSKNNIEFLKQIISYCNSKNIELVIVNTPLHHAYQEHIPAKFKNFYLNFMQSNKLKVIDFVKYSFSNDDFLPDGDHLSEKGSKKVSKIFNSLINHN